MEDLYLGVGDGGPLSRSRGWRTLISGSGMGVLYLGEGGPLSQSEMEDLYLGVGDEGP